MSWLRVRQVTLAILLVACAAGGLWLHSTGRLTQPAISGWVRSYGLLAPPVFVLVFALGELLHLPGMIFVVIARAAFGPVVGLALGYFGAIVAVTVPFLVVRGMRTQRERAWTPRWRLLARALDRVEQYPVRSVVVLRLVLWLAPILDYALAFTSIRTRDYVIGSALGIAPAVAAVAYGVGWLWHW